MALELQRSQYIQAARTIPQAVYDACLQGIRHKYNNLTHPFPTRIVPTTGMLGVMHIGHRCASIALSRIYITRAARPHLPTSSSPVRGGTRRTPVCLSQSCVHLISQCEYKNSITGQDCKNSQVRQIVTHPNKCPKTRFLRQQMSKCDTLRVMTRKRKPRTGRARMSMCARTPRARHVFKHAVGHRRKPLPEKPKRPRGGRKPSTQNPARDSPNRRRARDGRDDRAETNRTTRRARVAQVA